MITLLCETTLQSRNASCQDSVVSRPDSCWCKFQPWVVGAARTSAPWPPMELRACRPAPPPRLEAAICAGCAAVPESAALLPSCLCNTSPITEDPTSLGAQGRFHVHRVMRSTSTPPCACRVAVAESVHSRATTEDGQATPRATNGGLRCGLRVVHTGRNDAVAGRCSGTRCLAFIGRAISKKKKSAGWTVPASCGCPDG